MQSHSKAFPPAVDDLSYELQRWGANSVAMVTGMGPVSSERVEQVPTLTSGVGTIIKEWARTPLLPLLPSWDSAARSPWPGAPW